MLWLLIKCVRQTCCCNQIWNFGWEDELLFKSDCNRMFPQVGLTKIAHSLLFITPIISKLQIMYPQAILSTTKKFFLDTSKCLKSSLNITIFYNFSLIGVNSSLRDRGEWGHFGSVKSRHWTSIVWNLPYPEWLIFDNFVELWKSVPLIFTSSVENIKEKIHIFQNTYIPCSVSA